MISVARDRHPGLAHLPAGTIVTLECHNPPPEETHKRHPLPRTYTGNQRTDSVFDEVSLVLRDRLRYPYFVESAIYTNFGAISGYLDLREDLRLGSLDVLGARTSVLPDLGTQTAKFGTIQPSFRDLGRILLKFLQV